MEMISGLEALDNTRFSSRGMYRIPFLSAGCRCDGSYDPDRVYKTTVTMALRLRHCMFSVRRGYSLICVEGL